MNVKEEILPSTSIVSFSLFAPPTPETNKRPLEIAPDWNMLDYSSNRSKKNSPGSPTRICGLWQVASRLKRWADLKLNGNLVELISLMIQKYPFPSSLLSP